MAGSRVSKRFDRLIICVRSNDVKKLKHYVKRKKYYKLNLERAPLNRRKESLLLLASRLTKVDVVSFLLNHSIYDPRTRDIQGNSALHLALKAVLKIHDREEFTEGMCRWWNQSKLLHY